jgi:dienelactone hydrolase
MQSSRELTVPAHGVDLAGVLAVPPGADGVVVLAHASGSGRHSPRAALIACALHDAGLATLRVDLMTPHEERLDRHTRSLRFDIEWLADRIIGVTHWVRMQAAPGLPIGYAGASTAAAAALAAAAREPYPIGAVVSRGGRPDLAGPALEHVRAPTLLVVGGDDDALLVRNRDAYHRLHVDKALEVVPGAGPGFDEPGALDVVARLAVAWFARHLADAADTRRDLDPAASHF